MSFLGNVSTAIKSFLASTSASAACDAISAEKTSNKNAASGYQGLDSAFRTNASDTEYGMKMTKTAWTTAVAFTIATNISTNQDYNFEINYWIERIAPTSARRSGNFKFQLRRAGGTLTMLSSADPGSYGGYAPTLAWGVSGDNITLTITDALASGNIGYNTVLRKMGDLTT